MLVRKIRIDTGDIPVALAVGKRIAAGLIQILKGKTAKISENIDHLDVALRHTVDIQVYRLLQTVTPVGKATVFLLQILRPEHPFPY